MMVRMEIYDVMRTTGAVRKFSGEPLSDEVLARILDNARAFLSKSYRPLENEDLALAAIPPLKDLGVDSMQAIEIFALMSLPWCASITPTQPSR
mgnify:CR=1 FL=1